MNDNKKSLANDKNFVRTIMKIFVNENNFVRTVMKIFVNDNNGLRMKINFANDINKLKILKKRISER